ncbi:MAG: RluA family pseudouridine synthase [Phycisphaerales bacterium]|nr:RluA family pseudouridine synthase [Phycisphaerales bacterium]
MTTPPLNVVLEAADWAVIDKPPGLLSVPGKGDAPEKTDCVPARARAVFPRARGPITIHRLDMDTSGLMVIGLTAEAQRDLSAQFEARTVEKAYVALLDGLLTAPGAAECGVIDLPLRPDLSNRPFQIHDEPPPLGHGRRAVTRYRVLALETDRTRVRFEPVTGRAHQLRCHAAFLPRPAGPGGLGHPILGDVLYGVHRGLRPGQPVGGAPRLMLHASEISFTDPSTGRRVECRSPAPF